MRALHGLIAIALSLASPALAEPEPPAPGSVAELSPAALHAKTLAGAAPLFDVRTPAEFAVAHVPGAINISFDQIAARVASIDSSQGVVLYCMVGPRARKAEAALVAAGFRGAIYHLEGGLAAWQAAELAVEPHR
jgi:rhodanese-related sulfurtransferase